jgi:UDP-N-acetylglucosamine transferase subunit ALG13
MPRIPDNTLLLPATSYLLVTVGTTRFDKLITEINNDAQTIIDICYEKNITEIILQIGKSEIEPIELEKIAEIEYKKRIGNVNMDIPQLPRGEVNNDNDATSPTLLVNPDQDSIQREKKRQIEKMGKKEILIKKMKIVWVSYAQNFPSYLTNATMVISHAGAGSILETLRSDPSPQHQLVKVYNSKSDTMVNDMVPRLFVVINEDLMDNHQEELAEAFAEHFYLFYSKCSNFVKVLKNVKWEQIVRYPPPQRSAFTGLVAQTVNVNLNQGNVISLE